MDITQQAKPSLSQDANDALNQQSGSSGLPSLLSQFNIRTMNGDLKKMAPAPIVSPGPAPTAKAPAPTVASTFLKTPAPAITAQKEPTTKSAPLQNSEPAAEKQTKTVQEKSADEQKAAALAAKKAQEKSVNEQRIAKEAAAKEKELANKTALNEAKNKAAREQEARTKELRDVFERAKLKVAAKEYAAAIAEAQKIIISPNAGWLAKWRAKSLIRKAQQGIDKKSTEQPTAASAVSRDNSPATDKETKATKPMIAPTLAPRDERSDFYAAKTTSAPANLPTIEEVPAANPAPLPPVAAPASAPIPKTEPPVAPGSFSAPPKDPVSLTPPPAKIAAAAAPVMAPAESTPAKKVFSVPNIPSPPNEPTEELDMKKVALVGLVSILVLALIIGGLWYFLRQPSASPQNSQSASPSPLPTLAAPTPLPVPASLFKTDSQKIFELKTGQGKANFQEALLQLTQTAEPAGTFTHLLLQNSQKQFLSLAEIVSIAEIDLFDLPTQVNAGPLKNLLDMRSFSFFAYSQSAASSSPFVSETSSGRLGLIVELTDNSATTTVGDLAKSLKDLEQLMPQSLKILLPGLKTTLPAEPVWLNNTYKNTAIRYVNLPSADLSLDYAILNDKLIFATSKESIYALIDRLLTGASQSGSSPLIQ